MTVTQALEAFFKYQRQFHNGPDLLDRWRPGIETQINVVKTGKPVEGKSNTYTDGDLVWHNLRMPKDANSEPHFNDYNLQFPLLEYAEAIGCTGWDWVERKSRWFGYDFDEITSHAAGVGISEKELEVVAEKAKSLPYVEVRKSSGGVGLHLYVHCDGIPTANHTEHAALARCVLQEMSDEVSFDFGSHIDACGGNMWIWHQKATSENEGFKLIKPATTFLTAADLPSNWKDHIEVVTRKRSKVRVPGLAPESEDKFNTLVTSRRTAPLDDKHRAIIEQLQKQGVAIWISDHRLVQTHTTLLQELIEDEEIRTKLSLIGVFQTNSAGTDRTTPNCFMFPMPDGAFCTVRFSLGIQEADTWTQDGQGWTTCYFNRLPDLAVAAKAKGGIEMEKGGFSFESAAKAIEVIKMLGQKFDLAEKYLHREAILRKNKEGRVVIDIPRVDGDEKLQGWDSSKKGRWIRVLNVKAKQPEDPMSFSEWDKFVRHLKTPNRTSAGFMMKDRNNEWVEHAKGNVISALVSLGCDKLSAEAVAGGAILNSWRLVCHPFQPEFLPGRQWNLNAPQLRFQPSETAKPHIHWDKILNHVGQSLDEPLKKLAWAKEAGIHSGADYLRAIIKVILREPLEHTPYLFLHGPENSGKSILWEAIDLLMTGGVVKADRVFSSQGEFNGELAGCILAVLEERDITKVPGAHARLKDYVTGPKISIRKMYRVSYDMPNTTHWIQCANPDPVTGEYACPVFPGDTRITSIYVPPLPPGEEIPKGKLMKELEKEAPAFLRTILDLPLPEPIDRLRVPVVETTAKRRLQEANAPMLVFVDECLVIKPEAKVAKDEVYTRYKQWAESRGDDLLSQSQFGKKLMAVTTVEDKDVKVNRGAKRVNGYKGIALANPSVAV